MKQYRHPEVDSKEMNSNKDEDKRRIANDTQSSNQTSWDSPSRITENGGRSSSTGAGGQKGPGENNPMEIRAYNSGVRRNAQEVKKKESRARTEETHLGNGYQTGYGEWREQVGWMQIKMKDFETGSERPKPPMVKHRYKKVKLKKRIPQCIPDGMDN